ncbi:MAG: flagellar biosynthesis anti-sigma factor FlgM [Hydrogenothermaceae bacterium]|nr:flagellar biosynthesis anti-sigma factor FlgM [Hydrogenothermaceae bacterium]
MDDIYDKLRNKSLEDILKILQEEYNLRQEKLEKIKEMIEKGEYNIPVEDVVEKILKILKER